MKQLLVFTALVTTLGFSTFADAMTSIDLVGGVASTKSDISKGTTTSSVSGDHSTGGAYGIIFQEEGDYFAIETGLLYLKRSLIAHVTSGANSITEMAKLKTLQVPVLIRFGVFPYLSLGVGVALNAGTGDVDNSQSDPNNVFGGNQSKSESYKDAGLRKYEIAPDLSVQSKIPIGANFNFMFEANYQPATQHMSKGSVDTKLDVLELIAGIGANF